jgi:membrane protease subunit (stomatin/prohibitin family)
LLLTCITVTKSIDFFTKSGVYKVQDTTLPLLFELEKIPMPIIFLVFQNCFSVWLSHIFFCLVHYLNQIFLWHQSIKSDVFFLNRTSTAKKFRLNKKKVFVSIWMFTVNKSLSLLIRMLSDLQSPRLHL